jgi:lysophospholipase L1-like esterase
MSRSRLATLGAIILCACAQRPDPPAQTSVMALQSPAPRVVIPPPEEQLSVVTTPKVVETAPKKPRVVLHIGDSMVGYGRGLSLAMKKRFEAAGVEYHWDAWTSAQVQTLDRKRMDKLLAAFKPDLVLFNLGTNNLSVPHPEALADGIRSIVSHLADEGRSCVWIAPIRPKWKYNPKMYGVLEENVAPCKYFDAGPIDPPLQTDHIHPTDVGGEQWATPLWTFLGSSLGA